MAREELLEAPAPPVTAPCRTHGGVLHIPRHSPTPHPLAHPGVHHAPDLGHRDAAMRPDDVWAAAGQNKIVWVLVEIFLWTPGAAIYFLAIRPKLKAVARP